jgi:hypothetical protein
MFEMWSRDGGRDKRWRTEVLKEIGKNIAFNDMNGAL